MNNIPARIGASLDEIETPALVVDLDALDDNIATMAAFAAEADVRLRPHAKTHKCPSIAQRQMAAGAVGQCCQKVGEAEALVQGGIRDVLLSNQVVGQNKLRRLAALARGATIGLCFDDAEQVDAASKAAQEFDVTIDGLVEIDVGMQRCGVAPGALAVELAQRIAQAPGLRFRGLQAYHGAAQHIHGVAQRETAIATAAGYVNDALDALDRAGLACETVTGAGTGTFRMESASGLWNELQVGSYAFMDVDYARIGGADSERYTEFRHSLFVLASVMSRALAGHAIVDAGLKSYSGEKGMPWVYGREDVEVVGVSDEHGKLRLGPKAAPLKLGERVMLIPGHCDPTVNLHDWYVVVQGGRVVALWPITARGASY